MIDQIKKLIPDIMMEYTESGPERVGFLIPNKVVKVMNIAENPEDGFDVDPTDIINYTEKKKAFATWHTHPGSPANLSGEDFHTFKVWSNLYHLIVGNDGIRCYKYDQSKKTVLECFLD